MNVANTGQIKVQSPFGEWIANYAADTRFSRYVEIGTWNGQGSTCCFYEGFKTRTDEFHLQSYEINAQRVQEANNVWKTYPNIEIIHGRMLKDNECPSAVDVIRICGNINTDWHNEDIKNFWGCSYVPMNDPQVVLLDGAEYLTWFEFEQMIQIDSIRVFMLDDTNTAKCPKVIEWFSGHREWTKTAYSDVERNGWAVFEKYN